MHRSPPIPELQSDAHGSSSTIAPAQTPRPPRSSGSLLDASLLFPRTQLPLRLPPASPFTWPPPTRRAASSRLRRQGRNRRTRLRRGSVRRIPRGFRMRPGDPESIFTSPFVYFLLLFVVFFSLRKLFEITIWMHSPLRL